VDAVVKEAIAWGADLLITHHPLYLRPTSFMAADTFKGSVVHRLISSGIALYVAHTNADAAPRGVAQALADRCGLKNTRPLIPQAQDPERGLGRVGRLPEPMTLRAFAEHVAGSVPSTAQGVRVAGDLDAVVSSVAVSGGSGDGFFNDVRAAGVDVYVTADLRHHPTSEARERAEFGQGTPYILDLAHFASEWPWLVYAEADLMAVLPHTIETRVSEICTDPWTARM
jgi:dinuclear metal center YbgI/SA1388 family protein